MVYNLAETLKKMEEDVMLAREEGIEMGFEKGKIQIAKNMLSEKMSLDLIAEITGLSIEEIKALQTESNEKTH